MFLLHFISDCNADSRRIENVCLPSHTISAVAYIGKVDYLRPSSYIPCGNAGLQTPVAGNKKESTDVRLKAESKLACERLTNHIQQAKQRTGKATLYLALTCLIAQYCHQLSYGSILTR
ncbi:hypothetical protein OSTOST_01523, partial [Ostertagia ostertagi]